MKNYDFKRRSLFSGPHLLGLLFIVAGLISLVSPLIVKSSGSVEKAIVVGVGGITLGFMVVSFYEGTLIDFTKQRVKKYTAFMGYKFGQWSTLPVITKVVVVSDTYKASNTPNGISPTWSGEVTNYKVLLCSENASAVHSFIFSNKDRAISEAKRLSANLKAAYELR